MKKMLLPMPRRRSGTIVFIQNVTNTNPAAIYPSRFASLISKAVMLMLKTPAKHRSVRSSLNRTESQRPPRRIFGLWRRLAICCARVAIGHAAAPPSSVIEFGYYNEGGDAGVVWTKEGLCSRCVNQARKVGKRY